MFLVLLLLTLCLPALDYPWWLPRPGVLNCRGTATRPRTMSHCRMHPVLVAVVKVAVPAPAAPPLGTPQHPDPRAGWRMSIRPQPTRAPRYEAMVLGPLWRRGAARAVARAPARQWGDGSLTGGSAAAALCPPSHRVRLAWRPGGFPHPPLGGEHRSGGRLGDGPCLPRERQMRGMRQPLAPETPRPTRPALTPGTAAAQTKAHYPHAATLPRLTRTW